MRIVFVNSIGRKKWGGGEKWMVKAAAGLMHRGHQVWMGAKSGSQVEYFAKKEELSTVNFNISSEFDLITSLKIKRFLKANKIDVVICSLIRDVAVAGYAARRAETPVVLSRQGLQLARKTFKHRFIFQRFADGIITNTISIKQIYDGWNWFDDEFVKVLYNGVDISPVNPVNLHEVFPPTENKLVITAVGRLSLQKGFGYLLEAAKMAMQKRKSWVFIVVGEGKERKNMEQFIRLNSLKNTVYLAGFQKDTRSWISASDIFLLTSIQEGMPNVVMEAMSTAKPVVATDVNGVGELVVNNETGLIIPPENSSAVFDGLEKLENNPELREEMGKKGMERIKKHFTYDIMTDNLEAFLKRKLSKK